MMYGYQAVVCNILKHIDEKLNGVFPTELEDWINFYEMGPKTTALFLWLAFRKAVSVPVDIHVSAGLHAWDWTNGKTNDECCTRR